MKKLVAILLGLCSCVTALESSGGGPRICGGILAPTFISGGADTGAGALEGGGGPDPTEQITKLEDKIKNLEKAACLDIVNINSKPFHSPPQL